MFGDKYDTSYNGGVSTSFNVGPKFVKSSAKYSKLKITVTIQIGKSVVSF